MQRILQTLHIPRIVFHLEDDAVVGGCAEFNGGLAIGVGERFIVELEGGKATAQLGKALAAAKAAGMTIADTADTAEAEVVIEDAPRSAS